MASWHCHRSSLVGSPPLRGPALGGCSLIGTRAPSRGATLLFPFQHKHWMDDRLPLKILKGRVCGNLKEVRNGVAALDKISQNEGCLLCGRFSSVDRFGTTPTREGGLSGCPQVAHPIHHPIRGEDITLPVALNNRYRGAARQSTFAPAHREQVHRGIAGSCQLDAHARQGRCQNICYPHKARNWRCFCHIFPSFASHSFRRDVLAMTTICDPHKERGLTYLIWDNFRV